MGRIMSDREIARYYNSLRRKGSYAVNLIRDLCLLSADEVRDALQREGITVARRKRVNDPGNRMKLLHYDLGMDDAEIAKNTGLSISAVRAWRCKYGLPRKDGQKNEM